MAEPLMYLPPREAREITIDGCAVPKVEAWELDHGHRTRVILDGRFVADIPAELAQSVLWLLANAVAIGAGYSCHGEHSTLSNPFKVRVAEIR